MDGALFSLLFFFFAQIAAGVAPVRWPQSTWLARWIFGASTVGALACLVWYGYSNFELAIAHVDMVGRKTVGALVLILGSTLVVGGLSLIGSPTPNPAVRKNPTTDAQPKVVLLPAAGQLQMHNFGDELQIWGTRWAGNIAMDNQPRLVPKGHYYYFITDTIEQEISAKLGENKEQLVPFNVYIEDKAKKKFTANFGVLVRVKDGKVEFHTQQMGVSDGGW